MKENEEYIIRNIVQAYLNDNLEMCIESVNRKLYMENNSRIIRWFFDEHTSFTMFIGSVILVGIVCLIVIGCGMVIHNLEIDKLHQEAKVCIETGYGCKSSNQNTDIQYHDTPIIDIKK